MFFFVVKQKTAYEFEYGLVGSEMCIRDSLNPAGRLAIGAAAELYRGILTDIERNEYDVFNRRASLSAAEKLRRLPGIWLRARRGWAAGADALASETAPGPMSLA